MIMFMYFVDNSILLMAAIAFLLLLVVYNNFRLGKILATLAEENHTLKSNLNALCRGTGNVDRRLDFIDAQVKRVHERQERLDGSDVAKREYDHAIRAIKNGASFERLVNIHGLSKAEAKLLVSLHSVTSKAC